MGSRIIEISVIEDNPDDIFWLRHVLKQTGIANHLTIARDGEQGVDCLMHRGTFASVPPADLILLDMHMPKFGGLEVLQRVPNSAKMPICVLSSSNAESVELDAHFNGHACYLQKPISSEQLLEALHNVAA